MKQRYCVACKSMQDHREENEIIRKGCREFEYVCSACGKRQTKNWGKNRTLKFLNLPYNPALIKS